MINCSCGSTNIEIRHDIGFDITETGEERQHLDICRDCGLSRFWSEFISIDGRIECFHDEWEDNDDFLSYANMLF